MFCALPKKARVGTQSGKSPEPPSESFVHWSLTSFTFAHLHILFFSQQGTAFLFERLFSWLIVLEHPGYSPTTPYRCTSSPLDESPHTCGLSPSFTIIILSRHTTYLLFHHFLFRFSCNIEDVVFIKAILAFNIRCWRRWLISLSYISRPLERKKCNQPGFPNCPRDFSGVSGIYSRCCGVLGSKIFRWNSWHSVSR